MSTAAILGVSLLIGMALLSLALLLSVYRVIVGPTLPDRIVGLDMLVAVAIGLIAANGIRTGFALYIDIAIALSLVGFLATVAFARYVLVSAWHDRPEIRDKTMSGIHRTDVPLSTGDEKGAQ